MFGQGEGRTGVSGRVLSSLTEPISEARPASKTGPELQVGLLPVLQVCSPALLRAALGRTRAQQSPSRAESSDKVGVKDDKGLLSLWRWWGGRVLLFAE